MILGEFAAGEKEDFLDLNIASTSQASSILELGTHKKSYPSIIYTSLLTVPVKPVDDWLDSLKINNREFNFLNFAPPPVQRERPKAKERNRPTNWVPVSTKNDPLEN